MAKDWFERTWRYRDQELYPEIIGSRTDGTIVTIPHEAFERIGVDVIDPRWLHCGVLSFPPAPSRPGHVFVTSGLSNAWDDVRPDPSSITGLGIEMRIDTETPEEWPVDLLLRLAAVQLAIAFGALDGELIEDGDCVAVGAGGFGDSPTEMCYLFTAAPATRLALPSGTFAMMQLYPITTEERGLVAAKGSAALIALLQAGTTYPVSQTGRRSVV